MSYFDLPRIYFSGSFRASPSTINNTDSNYAEPPQLDELWNPKGSHAFQLLRGNEITIPPSATIQALKAMSPDRLSIRFTVDRLDANPTFDDGTPNPNFTLGRISGTIGPASAGEPAHITVGRMLRAAPKVQPFMMLGVAKETLAEAALADTAKLTAAAAKPVPFNLAPAKVDPKRNVVAIDLGNSLAFDGAGKPVNAGALQLAIQTKNGNVVLGPIDNSLANYLNRAFLFEVPLGAHAADAASNPLVVLSDSKVVMTENPSGAWIDAAEHVYRLDAQTQAAVKLCAPTFGVQAAAGP